MRRTVETYHQAFVAYHRRASLPQYRPLFEDSIRTFEIWLRSNGAQAHK